MLAFEYMRLTLSFRGYQANGPGAEQFAGIRDLDAMLAALGADGWELVFGQASDTDRMFLFKRPAE
jgi:hypothetical protein